MIGKQVGNYRVISLLGEGGMGAVYLAEHRAIARKASIKVLRPDLIEPVGDGQPGERRRRSEGRVRRAADAREPQKL